MTGNLIFFGHSLVVEDYLQAAYYFVLIVSFMAGVVAYRAVEVAFPSRGASILGFPLAGLMVVIEFVDMSPHVAFCSKRYLLAGLAPMFGMLTAACTTGKLESQTTMVTGYLTTIGAGLVSAIAGKLSTAERHQLVRSVRRVHGVGLPFELCQRLAQYFPCTERYFPFA